MSASGSSGVPGIFTERRSAITSFTRAGSAVSATAPVIPVPNGMAPMANSSSAYWSRTSVGHRSRLATSAV